MATEQDRAIDLNDDTRLNVASLLLEPVGSTREIRVSLARIELDEDLVATNVSAPARLTRLKGQILVSAEVTGSVQLECVTCLALYDQPFREPFAESFHQSVDVRTGSELSNSRDKLLTEPDEEEPGFVIDENHEIDLAEALRQWIVLSIPMQPNCGPGCPGPLLRSTDGEDKVDDRFAELAKLLEDESEENNR